MLWEILASTMTLSATTGDKTEGILSVGSDPVPVLHLCFEPDHSFAVFALLVNSLSA